MQGAAFGVNGATSITKMSKDDEVITRGRLKGKREAREHIYGDR